MRDARLPSSVEKTGKDGCSHDLCVYKKCHPIVVSLEKANTVPKKEMETKKFTKRMNYNNLAKEKA